MYDYYNARSLLLGRRGIKFVLVTKGGGFVNFVNPFWKAGAEKKFMYIILSEFLPLPHKYWPKVVGRHVGMTTISRHLYCHF